jgi:hypothetical protein
MTIIITSTKDNYLDKLLYRYDSIENILLTSNIENKLESGLWRFTNLKYLAIIGSKWYDLDCENIPTSVERLEFHKIINTPLTIMKHSLHLGNLHKLTLNIDFIMNSENIIAIPDLPKLKIVSLLCGNSGSSIDYLPSNIPDFIKNLKLFEKIKERIISIDLTKFTIWPHTIIVSLKSIHSLSSLIITDFSSSSSSSSPSSSSSSSVFL